MKGFRLILVKLVLFHSRGCGHPKDDAIPNSSLDSKCSILGLSNEVSFVSEIYWKVDNYRSKILLKSCCSKIYVQQCITIHLHAIMEWIHLICTYGFVLHCRIGTCSTSLKKKILTDRSKIIKENILTNSFYCISLPLADFASRYAGTHSTTEPKTDTNCYKIKFSP